MSRPPSLPSPVLSLVAASAVLIAAALTAGTRDSSPCTPEVVRYGASVDQLERALAGSCTFQRTRPIDPPFLENVKREQKQIDCEGFPFQGRGRHAEFVFRDGALVMVWIMTGPSEDASLERALTATCGPPKRRGTQYIQYPEARVALRLDKHEVLLYSGALAEEVETWFLEAETR